MDAQSGAVLRALPADTLRGWSGLRRFFEVTVRDAAGKSVAFRYSRFCPNSLDRWAVVEDPSGARYPETCPSGSPFVRGMVWGIGSGWAVPAFGFLSEFSTKRYSIPLARGSYTATVRIAPLYRSLLGVAPEQAEVTVDFTVEPASSPRGAQQSTPAPARATAGIPPAMSDPDPSLLPDLVALPPWNVALYKSPGGRDLLAFAASPWNAGPGPLVVEGFRRPGTDTMEAYQSFYEGDTPVGRTRAGGLVFDARRGHDHWHFLQFSRYSLIDPDRGRIMRSRKQSFCLAPTDAIDLTVPNAAWTPWSLTYMSVCGGRSAKWLREAMPVGWADTYFQVVAGQAFDVTSLPNGRYAIEIEVNPLGLLHERTRSNNVARRTVVLRGTRHDRRITVLPWRSISS